MTDDEEEPKTNPNAPEKERLDEDDFDGALNDAMDKEDLKEAKQDNSESVPKFDGFTITKNDLKSIHTHGYSISDETLAHSLHSASFEYIRSNRDHPEKNDLVVIYPAVMETFMKTCKASDVLKET